MSDIIELAKRHGAHITNDALGKSFVRVWPTAGVEAFAAEIEAKALEEAANTHWRSAMEKCKRDRVNPAERNYMFYGISLLRNTAAEKRAK